MSSMETSGSMRCAPRTAAQGGSVDRRRWSLRGYPGPSGDGDHRSVSGPEGRVVGLGRERLLLVGVPLSVLGGALVLMSLGTDAIELVLVLVGGSSLGYGAIAVLDGLSRIRSARVLRGRPGFLWAARCREVKWPGPTRLFVIEQGGVRLLSQQAEHVRGWAWAELGGAAVESVSTVGHEGNALVLRSRDGRRLARISFPDKELGIEVSVDDPDDPRAVILDRLRRDQRSSGL
jgi:hypothetical protein